MWPMTTDSGTLAVAMSKMAWFVRIAGENAEGLGAARGLDALVGAGDRGFKRRGEVHHQAPADASTSKAMMAAGIARDFFWGAGRIRVG